MDSLGAFLPWDRYRALAAGGALPERAVGAALFADISGFTAITEALGAALGPRRGAEELTRTLNEVYAALIAEVDRYGGSVIAFAGDAITCWFAEEETGRQGDRETGRQRDREGLGPAFAARDLRVSGPPGLLVSGAGASIRAVACGLALQAAMAPFAATELPGVGAAALAIKVAVATGTARRFVVGDPGVQLIDVLAGAIVDRLADAEHVAGRGEVVIDAATVAALGSWAKVAEWRPGERPGAAYAVVAGLGAGAEGVPAPLDRAIPAVDELRPWLLGPVYEQIRAGQEEFLAELRPATALFVGFGGLDYDGDDVAPLKLDALVRWAQRVLTGAGGAILQLSMGDKGGYMYAAFGALVAHDDAAERAVAAGMELAEAPEALGPIARLRIGVSQGRMRTGAYGGPTRRTYGVLGDEVNTAARVMQRARPGQVLVTQSVADAVARRYRLGLLDRLPLKGKAAAVTVSAVLGRRPPEPLARYTAREPLVGRQRELARLGDVLAGAAAGRGTLLRLEGGAGVGKSRVAAAWAARAQVEGFRVAAGVGQGHGRQAPYAVWGQIFRALLGLEDAGADVMGQVEALVLALDPAWGERLPLLADLLGLPFADTATTAAYDPRTRREALSVFAADLLAAWARAQPLLLVIEDAHWMDEASRHLTLAVARAVGALPAVLALVMRPAAGDDAPALAELDGLPHGERLALAELSGAEVGALVAARIGGPVDSLAVALVERLAGGNAFFSVELIEAMREAGAMAAGAGSVWGLAPATIDALREAGALARGEDGGWTLAPGARPAAARLRIPDTVQGVVLARVDRLPEAHRLTLKVASVLGQRFDLDVLEQTHPARPISSSLAGRVALLERRSFVGQAGPPDGRFAFVHSLTHEVVYDTLLEDQQRALHAAAGAAVEALRPDAVEELAYHYSRAGAREKTLIYLDLAARRARAGDANETALAYYGAALALEERAAWRQGQAEVLHVLGRREEERAALEVLERLPDADRFAVAYLWGQHHEATGDYGAARAAVSDALLLARGARSWVDEARCLAQLGLIARRQGDYEDAAASYEAALRLFGDERPGDGEAARALAQALTGLGQVYRQQGVFAEARTRYEQALGLAILAGDRRGEADALNGLGVTAYYQRDFAEALAAHRAALTIRRAIGDRAGEGSSLYNLALTLGDSGDYGAAEGYYRASLEIQQAVGNLWEEANLWNALGSMHLELGRYRQADEALWRAMELSTRIGDEAGKVFVVGNLALVARDQGDLAAAVGLLREGLAMVRQQGDRYVEAAMLSDLATVDLLAGRPGQAAAGAAEALALRRALGLEVSGTADLATLAAAHLALGDAEVAAGHGREALALLDACGGEGPEAPQRDYLLAGRVLAALGDAGGARRAFDEARRLLMLRADKLVDPELRRSFLDEVPLNREIMGA